MADRILAAMDYLDAYTKIVPHHAKQRALGDIDGKYSVVDPLLEISYYPSIKNDVSLAGVKKINPSNGKSPEEIVEEDRERMIQSAERAKSAPSPFKDQPVASTGRPMTSSSWATGSFGTRDDDKRIHHSLLTSASRASIKRLSFTSPAVNVGPADVRDEIMDEIVSKPLVFQRNNFKSQSAPPGGRYAPGILKSAGTRSTRWLSSPKRARTSYRRQRNGTKLWEKSPGPFMTVKVSGTDLWVISNSTPTSYFDNNQDDGLRETSGANGTKVPKWEDTAEAVPKPEQTSPPRHERLLGAPAQFAPTIQWLRYDPSGPARKPPVLTPFKESLSNGHHGKYYNVESSLSGKVSQHLNASPGVRIARNGTVLSHSLKFESSDGSERESDKESVSDDSDIDITSIIPAKLAAKIKKHYVTPENEKEESEDEELSESEKDETKKEDSDEVVENGVNEISEDEKEEVEKSDASFDESEKMSEISSISEDENEREEARDEAKPMLTKDNLALLTKLSKHDLSNPILDGSNESATSFETLETYELDEVMEQNGEHFESPRIDNAEQDDVWRILENGTPNFWITKSKQQKMAILKRMRRQRKSEQLPSGRESLQSGKTKEDYQEVILPLCWADELNKSNSKILQVKASSGVTAEQNENTSLPVVFHKVIRYDVLPTATTSSPLRSAVSSSKNRSTSATSHNGGISFGIKPSKGYRAPVSTPRSNRSVRTKSASTVSSASASSTRGHSAPHSIVNGTEIVRQSIDLADLLRVTPDSLPAKMAQVSTRSHSVKKEHVTIVHEDHNENESLPSKSTTHRTENTKDLVDSNNVHMEQDDKFHLGPKEKLDNRITAPVGTINLSGINSDYTTSGTPTFSSQRRTDVKSSSNFTTPQNTPKTPMLHHSVVLTPRNSARAAQHGAKRLPDMEEEMPNGGDSAQDDIPLSTKRVSLSGQEQQNVITPRTAFMSRTRGGFSSVPLSQSRLKSGSLRGSASHFLPSHNGMNTQSNAKPMKAYPNMQTGIINGTTDISTVQIGQNILTGHAMKTADFIQITQSLHISNRSGGQGDVPGVTGNKMYDSYMRELAAHNATEYEERGDAKSMILGRSLGGTSGKSSGFSLPRSVKKNLSGYRSQQHSQAPNITPFTPQAGRRSGLTMVPQDAKILQHHSHVPQKIGPFGLGVKGDQVRLNIDKNIHNIYRDLGLLKSANEITKTEDHISSPGRSHLSSAKSRTTVKEESVISIPTASEASAAKASLTASKYMLPDQSDKIALTKRPSSSNPSVIVQDSGTQWSGRTVKFGEIESRASPTTDQSAEDHSKRNSLTEDLAKPPCNGQSIEHTDSHPKTPVSISSEEPKTDTDAVKIPVKEVTSSENNDSARGESRSPTSDRSLARAISRTSDAVSASESNFSVQSIQPAPIERSASETLLDRLAELGDRDGETSDVTEDEADDVDVKGVTRVTVNMPVKTDNVS
ncbi:uncharacterized protein LOC120338437 isoform X1 [Styela clava]